MARGEENFLERWSQLKREHVRALDAPAKPSALASAPGAGRDDTPALPPLDALTPESDFTVFMNPKVADALRRAALKTLFRHPEINVPDPFEPFCDDLTGGEPIPGAMLKSLLEARDAILRLGDPRVEEARGQGHSVGTPDPESEARVPEQTDVTVLEPRDAPVRAALDLSIGEGS